jgi:hypothetical protein
MEKSCFVKNKISYSDSCKYFFATEIIKIQDFVSMFNVSGGHVFQQIVRFLMEVPNVLPVKNVTLRHNI